MLSTTSVVTYSRRQSTSCATVFFLLCLLIVFVSALSSPALAATDFCSGGVLDQGAPLGQTGPDLVITNMSCLVDGTKSPYNFHNVYIFCSGNQTGTLTFSDVTMHFYAANILVQNQGALIATGIGANNDGNVLTIHLYGDGSEDGITCKKMDGGWVSRPDSAAPSPSTTASTTLTTSRVCRRS